MPLHVLHMQEERLDTARRLPFLHSRHTLHTYLTIRQLPRFTSNTPRLQVMRPEYARHKKGLLFIYNKVRQPPCAPRSFFTIPALIRANIRILLMWTSGATACGLRCRYRSIPYRARVYGLHLFNGTQLLRRDFSISMINVEPAEPGGDLSDMRINIPEWDFILGWGAFGSPTDIVMQHLHKRGHKSPRGLCIGGNAVTHPAFQAACV